MGLFPSAADTIRTAASKTFRLSETVGHRWTSMDMTSNGVRVRLTKPPEPGTHTPQAYRRSGRLPRRRPQYLLDVATEREVEAIVLADWLPVDVGRQRFDVVTTGDDLLDIGNVIYVSSVGNVFGRVGDQQAGEVDLLTWLVSDDWLGGRVR